jgi:hypothetical protein
MEYRRQKKICEERENMERIEEVKKKKKRRTRKRGNWLKKKKISWEKLSREKLSCHRYVMS